MHGDGAHAMPIRAGDAGRLESLDSLDDVELDLIVVYKLVLTPKP
jgi:hypothetical protein